MSEKRIGIIMHGVTGRMGMNQHLIRSILEIRKQGGVALKDGTRLMPDPLLVGRNAAKVEELARKHGVQRWTSDLDAALKGPDGPIPVAPDGAVVLAVPAWVAADWARVVVAVAVDPAGTVAVGVAVVCPTVI